MLGENGTGVGVGVDPQGFQGGVCGVGAIARLQHFGENALGC